MRTIVGVDPGMSGGIAVLKGSHLCLLPIPSVKAKGRGRTVEWEGFGGEIFDLALPRDTVVYIEQVGARPGQGSVSMFKFGYVCGWLRGCFDVLGYEVVMVTPQKWKKKMNVTSDKNKARQLATDLFPIHAKEFARVKDDGVAEAALIAAYGEQMEKELSK